jgi:pectin methylesterase-like acyl-CoA thioesterase
VSNSGGSLTSSQATLTVTQLTISTQPTGVVTPTDASQTIGVTVTANPPPSYQWQKSVDGLNWTNVAGGTGSSLSANLTATNSGFYRVIASNSVGSVTSSIVMAGVVSTNLGNAVLSPTNGSAAVNRDTPLRLTFASPPVVGSAGTIRVYDAASNTLVASYDLGAMTVRAGTTTGGTNFGVFRYATRVINGDSVLHTPVISLGSQPGPGRLPAAPAGYDANAALISLPSSTNLAYGRTYYVLMDPGTFVDSQGAPFAGITNTNAWTFTVKSSGPAAGSTNLIVGNDGTPTDFSTLQGAADFVPTGNSNATVVSLRQGFYPEVVHWKSPNVTISGQGRTNTVIAWINNNNINPSTSTRPVMNVVASNVCLRDLSVYNMTPYGGSQAESLYTVGNAIVLNRVGLYSYQDTLLANTGSLFVTDSYIEGATDYIWGYAASYFQRCELKANTNGAYYTQARNSQTSRGFSFVNCTLDAYPGVTNSSATLSRTFGSSAPFSQTAYVNCRMGPHIQPAGWYINDTTNTNATLQLWEYQSRDLSNNALNVSQRAAFNRSFSVSGTNIVYTAGQTNSPDVLTNGQISAALAALMTNWSNQLGGWVPAAATPDPVMVPRFGSNIAAYQNSEFRDPGATLADPVDGTVTLYSTTPVSTAALGSLTITYPGYTNSLNIVYSGTSAVVTVVTNAPPVLNGSSNITAVWGAGFADPGATIVDPYSGTQTVYGTENGLPLDSSRLGSHTLTYVYTNSQGEVTAPVQRTVVVDTVVPALPVFGTNSYDITVPNPSINGGSPASTNNSTNANAAAINAYINFCSTNGGGTVTVPSGTFNTGLVILKSNVNLRLASNAVLRAASYNTQLLGSTNATNVAITGYGALDGGATTNAGNANLIVLNRLDTVLIQGISIQNAGHEHLVMQYCRNVTVDGIDLNDNGTLAANGGNYLANTDGIDYYGTNFLFKNCTIADGDDNIVAKPLGSGCANITITNCTATAGHGFGIGGGMLYGVSCFLVTDSTLSGTAYGVRIKAQDNPNFDQGGLVSNAVYRNITMSNVRRPLILESYYDGTDNYPSSPTDTNNYTLLFSQFATNGYTYYPTYYSAIPRTNTPYTPTFKNISFINVTASNAVYPGNFEGGWYTTPNIDGLTFSNVTVQTTSTSRGFNIWHATNVTAYNLRILTPTNNAYYGTNSNRPISGVYSYDVGNFSVSAPLIQQAFFTFNAADTNGTYNGAPQPVGVTVDPADALPVIVTYSGSNGMVYGPTTNAPVNAGSYTVTATTPNTNYTGSGTATLVIAPATPTFVFDSNSLSATYTGSGIAVSLSGAGSTPVTISYDFDTYLAVTAGTHTVVATVTDTNNYSPYSVTNTLTIAKATALVTLSGMSQPFNNTPRSVTVGTSPTNLEVGVTYNGSPTAPSAVGSYAVTASVVDANYAGSNTGTLVIYDPAGRWRSNAFGTTNNSGSAADSAIGSSGLANQQAYALGVDPNSPSTNVPLACTASGTNFSVSFTAKTAGTDPGYGGLTRYYTLEGTTNLIDSNSWSSIGGYSNIEATNQTVIYSTNTTGAAKWFYRLRVWLQ